MPPNGRPRIVRDRVSNLRKEFDGLDEARVPGSATLNDGSTIGHLPRHLAAPPQAGSSARVRYGARAALVHRSERLRYLMLDIEISVP